VDNIKKNITQKFSEKKNASNKDNMKKKYHILGSEEKYLKLGQKKRNSKRFVRYAHPYIVNKREKLIS